MGSYPPGGRPPVPPAVGAAGPDRKNRDRIRPGRTDEGVSAEARSAAFTGKGGRNSGGAPAKRGTPGRARPQRPADPRRTAYDVLAAVRDREAYANLLLPRLLADRHLTGRDAALTTELTYGTLRGRGTYDAVLATCSDRPLEKLDPPVLDVLRLGTHQLLSTRVGAHAAVATSVDLARSVVGPRVSGYVNAVLRRVATRDLNAWLDIVAPDPAADPDGYLAVRYSHPRWIVAAYRAALGDTAGDPAPQTGAPGTPAGSHGTGATAGTAAGDTAGDPAPQTGAPGTPAGSRGTGATAGTAAGDAGGSRAEPVGEEPATGPEATGPVLTELEAALAAGNTRPRVTLATFPSGPPREDVMPPDAEPGRWSPYAFTLAAGDPAPLIEAGTAAVQDEGSQLAAIALARAPVIPWPGRTPRPGVTPAQGEGEAVGERWLDMCAGPGGKARLLYGLAAERGARLTAAELHPHRAALVRDALTTAARTVPGEPPPFEVLVADGTRPPWPAGAFDRVLLDVPCSGLGALRRRPEARWRKAEADLPGLIALQRGLLRSALAAVRPGGVVAYVTCSPVPGETSDVVTDVVTSLPGTEVLDVTPVLPGIPRLRAASPLFAQLWPHRHGTDAIFIALLRHAAD